MESIDRRAILTIHSPQLDGKRMGSVVSFDDIWRYGRKYFHTTYITDHLQICDIHFFTFGLRLNLELALCPLLASGMEKKAISPA